MGRKKRSKRIGYALLPKSNQLVADGLIIVGKAHKGGFHTPASLKTGKLLVTECTGHLPCPIRAEIIEDNRISVLNRCHWSSVLRNHGRRHKLICLSLIVGFLNCSGCTGTSVSFPLCHSIVSRLHTIPVLVTIHGIITSRYHRHFSHSKLCHFSFESRNILFAGCGRSVAPVKETIYIYL